MYGIKERSDMQKNISPQLSYFSTLLCFPMKMSKLHLKGWNNKNISSKKVLEACKQISPTNGTIP